MKITRLLLLLGLTVPLASVAQDDSGLIVEIPFYDVEVAIFKNLRVPKGSEFVPPISSPSRDDNTFDLSSRNPSEAEELGYSLITSDEYRLVEIVARLVKSSRYQLLTHVSWRQPGLERKAALPVWIEGGRIFGDEYISIDNQIDLAESNPEQPDFFETLSFEFDPDAVEAMRIELLLEEAQRERDKLRLEFQASSNRAQAFALRDEAFSPEDDAPITNAEALPYWLDLPEMAKHDGLYELEGNITIALSRYLHVHTDLVLRRLREPSIALANASLSDQDQSKVLNNYSLKEHRRMRSKNLHYLDNPEFSMLILITPYEAPVEIEEAEIEGIETDVDLKKQ